MANYVLVHGAWGGGHSFNQTAADLNDAGHTVCVAELVGLGARSEELHPGITLTDHINDVCEQAEAAGFDRFILVGHSYGGMVITGVAAKLGARIDGICFIDAFLPNDNQSLWDITGDYEHNWYIEHQKDTPGLIPPIGQADFEPVPGIVGRHPLLTLLEAVHFTGEEALVPKKAYIFANDYQPTPFAKFANFVQTDPNWDFHETKSDHFVMARQPRQVVDILLGLAD